MKAIYLSLLLFLTTSCLRSSPESWEDLKTAGRYVGRGVDELCGKGYESKMLASDDEFIGPYDDEFIPLRNSDLLSLSRSLDAPLPQPKEIPGERNLPPISEFCAPSGELRSLFQSVHFATDEHVVKDPKEVAHLIELARYLKTHPNTYIAIEGHTDERASASYNLALGMRRANYVRSFLVKQGVDLNRIYTVSKGKETPIALEHGPDAWKVNRRSEFKVYQR